MIFKIHVHPHSIFSRYPSKPHDLSITLKLSLSEALLGFSRTFVAHLDGGGIRIQSKRGERVIQHGDEYLIMEQGMPVRGSLRRGNLRVKFEVEMPGASWASRQTEVSRRWDRVDLTTRSSVSIFLHRWTICCLFQRESSHARSLR